MRPITEVTLSLEIILMMMKVRYIKVLRETYNIRTRYLRYRGGFDSEESAEGAVLANDSM